MQDADTPVRRTWPVEQEVVVGQCCELLAVVLCGRSGSAHGSTRRHTVAAPGRAVDTPRGVCDSSRSVSSPSAPASAAGALAIDIRQLPWMRRLAADYAFAFDDLAPFYAGDPRRPEAWTAVIDAVHAVPRATPALSALLTAQLSRRGAPAAALDAAAAFARPSTVAVVTGQQAGLFGGPLYTLHKAITAIKLAREVTATHGVTAVPVFWIDSEDHDWEEVRRCTVLDDEQMPHTVTAGDVAGAGDQPIARLVLDGQVAQAIDALAGILPVTEFTAELLARVRAAYAPGRGMSEAFGALLDEVLGPLGLVVYDAADPAAKPLASGLFARALQDPGRTGALAATAGEALEARGYHAQVTASDQSAPLFLLDGTREAVRYRGATAIVGDRELPLAELVALAGSAPERFSPNVLLRPLVQDTIFPTVCYVGGPSELAYLGQLRQVYAHFAVPMPLVVPRASATVVDSAALRFLGKHDIPLPQFQRQDELTLNHLLESQLPKAVETSFADAGAALTERLDAVMAAARIVDATLEGAARSTLGKMQHDLQALHGKVVQAAKRKDETLRRQFTRTRTQLFPNGQPQERELGLVWLLNRYGPATVDRLVELLPVDAGHHWVITI
ncbi:MAG: bacillithiol biosynthesis cysteine-adding enzyme BshC [Vicinamibacterales bacterium]